MFLLSLFLSLFLTLLNSWSPLNLKLVSSQFTIFLDSLSPWPFIIPALPILALFNPAIQLIFPVPCSGVFTCHPESSVLKLLPSNRSLLHTQLSFSTVTWLLYFPQLFPIPEFLFILQSPLKCHLLKWSFPLSCTSLDSPSLFFSSHCVFVMSLKIIPLYASPVVVVVAKPISDIHSPF